MTLDSAVLLYTYISRFSVNPHHRQTEKIRQSCRLKLYLKPLLIPFFNFSHKWPTFAFTPESGYTLGLRRKIAHKGTHGETGAFLPSATAWLRAASEIFLFRHAFIYIHFPVLCEPSLSATVLSQTIFHRVFQLLAQTAHICFHG